MKKSEDILQNPTQNPQSLEEHALWQEKNRAWWQSHLMRYDWRSEVGVPKDSQEFYQEIDRRFFMMLQNVMPWKKLPFESLIDYESLHDKNVLEIGVGAGSHAQLLAPHSKTFHGIDITDAAIEITRKRFELFNIDGVIETMDAERMSYPDASFDLVWSWGVIHHSANTRAVLKEIYRVLKPGGTAITMVYHRGWYNYYFVGGVVRGILSGGFFKHRSIHKIIQQSTDGALARYYTIKEWKKMVGENFTVRRISTLGQKDELIPLPGNPLKKILLRMLPNAVARFFLKDLHCGSFLIVIIQKK